MKKKIYKKPARIVKKTYIIQRILFSLNIKLSNQETD